MAEQMELDEALRLLAGVARQEADVKTQHAALRTVLQVHGVLSDKPLPPTDRRSLARQIDEIVGRIKDRLGASPGSKVRIRAMLAAEVSAASETPDADPPSIPGPSGPPRPV